MTRFYKNHFKAQLIFTRLIKSEKWYKSMTDWWQASSYAVSSVHSGTKTTWFGLLTMLLMQLKLGIYILYVCDLN